MVAARVAASSGCGRRSLGFPTGRAPGTPHGPWAQGWQDPCSCVHTRTFPGLRAGRISSSVPYQDISWAQCWQDPCSIFPSSRHRCSGIIGTGQHTSRVQHTKTALSPVFFALFLVFFFFFFSLSTVSFPSLRREDPG